jgi:hypothetical protein
MRSAESKQATEALWAERVRQWRESGKPARVFADGGGYAVSTLYRWAERLASGPVQAAPRRARRTGFMQLVAKQRPPTQGCEVLVEVGAARVRVGTGFNAALLVDVVRALGGGAR